MFSLRTFVVIYLLRMLTLFITNDHHIGRFNPTMLTDHQMMEMFFTPHEMDTGEYYASADRDDACTWKGVTCGASNTIRAIVRLSDHLRIMGTIDFKMIPLSVEELFFADSALFGEVDTSALPVTLTEIALHDCKFSGSLEMRALPPNLKGFYVIGNKISFVSELCNLPSSLTDLIIAEDFLTHKSIHIGKLHKQRIAIDIMGCRFAQVTFDDRTDEERVSYK